MVKFQTLRKDIDTVRKNLGDPKKLGLGEFPQGTPKGTVPIGDGWYATPSEPADPQNCDRYPDSPWCGGNPIDVTKPIGYDFDAQVHGCGFDVELGGTVGWIKMPPERLSYRFEGECRKEPPPPPPPLPGQKIYKKPSSLNANQIIYAFVGVNGTSSGSYGYMSGNKFVEGTFNDSGTMTWTDYQCPGAKHILRSNSSSNYFDSPIGGDYSWSIVNTDIEDGKDYGSENSAGVQHVDWDTSYYGFWRYGVDATGQTVYEISSSGNIRNYSNNPTVGEIQVMKAKTGGFSGIYYGKWGVIDLYLGNIPAPATSNVQPTSTNRNYSISTGTLNVHIDFVCDGNCVPYNPHRKNPPPDNDDNNRKCNCMTCCPDNSDLLRQLLAEIKKANKAIGSDQFPAAFPKGLTAGNDSTISIPDIANLLKQQVVYLDEIVGHYPLKIKVQDTDATTEGNQSTEMSFPNTSELLGELFGVSMNTSINSELIIQLLSKNLIELAVTRKQIHSTQSCLKAMENYLGYDVKEATENVPFTISVPQSDKLGDFSMDDFLKTSTQSVEVSKLERKEIGAHKKYMLMLEKTSGIIRAVFWRKLAKGGIDLADQVKNLLKKQHQTINDVDKHQVELEKWLEEYERGFTSSEGYSGDSSLPWGEPYDERPKTKIIGKVNADVVDPNHPPSGGS